MRTFTKALIVFALLALPSCPGCPPPTPGGPSPIAHVVDCGAQAVKDQAIALIPAINTCLVGGGVTSCLLSLLDPVAGITEDLIACLVRSRGAEYAASAQANPTDSVSSQAAASATRFLNDRGITFSP